MTAAVRLLAVLALLSGCAGVNYFEVGAGLQIGSHSDYWIRGHRPYTGTNPNAYFALGRQFENNWRCAYEHESHWFQGFPLNTDPELYQDQVRCVKRFMLKLAPR